MLFVGYLSLTLSSVSLGDDSAHNTQVIDSSSDRTPATTAFPAYPSIARRDRIEGDAKVCFKIDQHGRIRSARVVEVSHPIFKRPAIAAIRQSSFEPLDPHEVLAAGRTCRTYRFRLEPILVADE
jgi:TonB family protein